jgi:hypothetical protein
VTVVIQVLGVPALGPQCSASLVHPETWIAVASVLCVSVLECGSRQEIPRCDECRIVCELGLLFLGLGLRWGLRGWLVLSWLLSLLDGWGL